MTVLTTLGLPRRSGPPGGGTLLSDRFDGANGTALDAHTPDTGGAWTIHDGTPTLNGTGRATDAETYVASVDCGEADVTMVVAAEEATTFRAIFRLTDAANYWYAQYDTGLERLSIFEVVAGVPTSRTFGTRSNTGSPRTLTVAIAGATVSATLDGGAALNYATMATGLGATRHGIGGDAGSEFEDITIEG